MLGISAAVAVLSDFVTAILRRNTLDLSDLSSITMVWVFTLLMPASLRYTVLIVGSCITVFIGKHAFGGYGSYPFNPAALGFAFTAVAYPAEVFSYPAPFSMVPLDWNPKVDLFKSPMYTISQGARPDISITDLILGEYKGPIGTTFCIVALSCLVLLIVHSAMSWHIPVTYMVTFGALAFAFPRIQVSRTESLLIELICGLVPFSAAYLVSEPSSSPKNNTAKLLYGMVLAVVSMIFTRYGKYEVAICFALLLCSPVGSYLDRKLEKTVPQGKEVESN